MGAVNQQNLNILIELMNIIPARKIARDDRSKKAAHGVELAR
jgi:hypothetical protein